jgi:hypothetical protein
VPGWVTYTQCGEEPFKPLGIRTGDRLGWGLTADVLLRARGNNKMKKVKIYLSSSAELKGDRHEVEMLFARMNQHSQSHDVFYELLMWETLPAAVSNMRMQDEYNKIILECDVIILLVHSKIGKYTLEEFETAYRSFLEKGKPLIFTYFKDTSIRTSEVTKSNILSLIDFKNRLGEIGHFYLQYQTTESLKLSLATQMQRYFEVKFVGDFSKKSSTNNINVFVSYNHNDKETAIKVVEKLKENGFSTIIDIESMLPGSDIQSFIEDSIL